MYCQKCRIPLKPDPSLETLNPAAFDLLVGSASRSQRKSTNYSNPQYPPDRKILYGQTARESDSPVHKRHVPPPIEDVANTKAHGNPDMSFIEITESQLVPIDKQDGGDKPKPTQDTDLKEHGVLAQQISRHDRLFSFLSSHSDIDHPICSECSMILVSSFNSRLASATRERDAYASFLRSLQQATARTNNHPSGDEDEDKVFRELIALEEEKKLLDAELADLEEESQLLDLQERTFWRSRNTFDDQLYELETDLTSLQQRYAHDQQQLEKLQRTNVYNDTFCIGHDGFFGTINGLRLGRLSSQNIEWAEINAAWGQTLLLLVTVAERLSFPFHGYRLRPLGSTSRIEKLEWPQQLPDASITPTTSTTPPAKITYLDLFSSGDMPLGRVFNHRRFDAGMVAFLDCLSQLGQHVDRTSKSGPIQNASASGRTASVVLPYSIEGDKIGGISIRLGVGFQQDENFTKACKYTLTCCKFLLAHVSNLESSKALWTA